MSVRRTAYLCTDNENTTTSLALIVLLFGCGLLALVCSVYTVVDVSTRVQWWRRSSHLGHIFNLRSRNDFLLIASTLTMLWSLSRVAGLIVSIQLRFQVSSVQNMAAVSDFIAQVLNTMPPWLLLGLWLTVVTWAVYVAPVPRVQLPMAVRQAFERQEVLGASKTPQSPARAGLNIFRVAATVLVSAHAVAYIVICLVGIVVGLVTTRLYVWWNLSEAISHAEIVPVVMLALLYLSASLISTLAAGQNDRIRQLLVLIGITILAGFSVGTRAVESLLETLVVPLPDFPPVWLFNWGYSLLGCDLFMTLYLSLIEVAPLTLFVVLIQLYGPDPHQTDLPDAHRPDASEDPLLPTPAYQPLLEATTPRGGLGRGRVDLLLDHDD
ncbi:hypothetical protein J8273_3219 [Carpediemonas membranifera]|uniref:Uncharacterized protein n=1 Tax=Carpediemonas membranifera TaxID=201153 RepID=A0A8J6AW69_9EUKA|nr:hypothetical protein J8273_3219 [Carpediemonas membranifera]|eukprot:KAG9393090.1 hypothetical protein J8273_3219 [Carpediemonas membranifera]